MLLTWKRKQYGLEILKQKSKEEKTICFTTDKSGRWAADSKVNFISACEKHLATGIKEISINEHNEIEKHINCHMLALLRMMGQKDDFNGERVRNASIVTGNTIAPLYSLRKDHKDVEIGKETEGPKTRPVCGAKDCLNMRLSHTLSLILKELLPDNSTYCDSTEDLLAEIENLNNDEVNTNWEIGSLDIEALYPSLDIPKCAEVVSQELYKSDIEIKNINWKEVMLYLRYMLDDNKIRKKGLWRFCPKRRCAVGRPPTFTSSGSVTDREERFKSWKFRKVKPCRDIIRIMFCEAIRILIRETISNHAFQFNGNIFKQETGGAIGLELVGVIANIYMCWWDRQLIQLMNDQKLKPKIYKRYVDDINLIVEDMENKSKRSDENIMRKVRELANTVDENIKATFDYGSKYADGKLPMLDLKLWIGKDEKGDYKVLHTHYTKEVSSKFLIHERSSHPENMKFNTLVNEGLRILRNCNVGLSWNEIKEHLQIFIHRMQFSGYIHEYRAKVMELIFKKYDEKIKKYKETGKMYRSRADQEKDRSIKNKRNKHNWYDKSKYDGVLFVEVTEKSELMNRVQKACKRNKLRVKVVEKMNNTIKRVLQRSNPFKSTKCGRDDCNLCKLNMNVDCRCRGCVYKIVCTECNKRYIGQTCRSMYDRTNEHYDDWREKKERSVLHKHSVKYHNNLSFNIKISIIANCFGKPTTRMITEAVYIDQLSDEQSLNSKTEWSYVKLPTTVIQHA